MDIEKLITLVFENKCLWDMKDKTYHNRDVSRRKWEKISQELEANVETVKNKWRGLRDTFRKELHKLPKRKSGDGGGPLKRTSWPYFASMMFLRDQFLPRNLQSSIPEPLESDSSRVDVTVEDYEDTPEHATNPDLEELNNSEITESEPPIQTTSENVMAPPAKRTKKRNVLEKLLDIEQTKLAEYKRKIDVLNTGNNEEDADYHFLMSLLPALRKIPDERKMFVRTRLQQVFCDEQTFGQHASNSGLQQKTNCSTLSSIPQQVLYTNPSSSNSTQHTWESLSTSPTDITTPPSQDITNRTTYDLTSLTSYFSTHDPRN